MHIYEKPKALALIIGVLVLFGISSCDFLTRKRLDKYADRSVQAAENWHPDRNDEGLYGYVDPDESLVIEYQFRSAYKFVQGAAMVKDTNAKMYLIDTNGNRCSREFFDLDRYKELGFGMIRFDTIIGGEKERRSMLVTMQGKPISKAYPRIMYKRKRAQFIAEEQEGEETYKIVLDREGKRLPGRFTNLYGVNSHSFYIASFVKDSEKQSFLLSHRGDTMSKVYDGINRHKFGKFLVCRGESNRGAGNFKGLLDTLGNEVLAPKYYDIKDYQDKGCLYATIEVSRGKRKYELLDLDGKVLKTELQEVYFPQKGSLIGIKTDRKHYQFFRLEKGDLVSVGQEYVLHHYVNSGTRRVLLFFKQSYRSVHDDIVTFAHGRARVQVGNKFGFIDETGKVVIPIQYQEAEAHFKGKPANCEVRIGKDEFMIDTAGKRVE